MKKRVVLKRLIDEGKETLGVFTYTTDDNHPIVLVSLELSWKDNAKNISCIPVGIYKVVTTYSNKYKRNMWLLKNVYNRTGVRIHAANYFTDLQGCIGLGLAFKDLNNDNKLDIVSSTLAINKAIKDLGTEFELEITY